MIEDPILRLEDLAHVRGFSARPGLCRAGTRAWFARHGLDWQDFRRNGIAASRLLAIGDVFAVAAVTQTQARRAGEKAHG